MSPVFNDEGVLVGRSARMSDVTKRREAEQRLVEANERFEQTIANAAIGMALVGTDGSWLEVNPALCEIVGYGHDELMTKGFQDITHPEDLDADLELLQEVLDGRRASSCSSTGRPGIRPLKSETSCSTRSERSGSPRMRDR